MSVGCTNPVAAYTNPHAADFASGTPVPSLMRHYPVLERCVIHIFAHAHSSNHFKTIIYPIMIVVFHFYSIPTSPTKSFSQALANTSICNFVRFAVSYLNTYRLLILHSKFEYIPPLAVAVLQPPTLLPTKYFFGGTHPHSMNNTEDAAHYHLHNGAGNKSKREPSQVPSHITWQFYACVLPPSMPNFWSLLSILAICCCILEPSKASLDPA